MIGYQATAFTTADALGHNTGVYKIMVVDDSQVILRLVSHTLQQEGYDVSTAVSGEEALSLIRKHGIPHLAIVDINMPPGMDGFEFCRQLHSFSDVPIIMLSAEQEEQIVALGLDRYAEDYIVKPDDGPLRVLELSSRVRRVLLRIGTFGYMLAPLIRVDARLQVNFAERYILINGQQCSLTPTETKILYVLMRHAGRTVANDFLLQRVWPLDEAYEDRLHTHVYRLRRKLEKDPKQPEYITADWGKGYIFPPVQMSEGKKAEGRR